MEKKKEKKRGLEFHFTPKINLLEVLFHAKIDYRFRKEIERTKGGAE